MKRNYKIIILILIAALNINGTACKRQGIIQPQNKTVSAEKEDVKSFDESTGESLAVPDKQEKQADVKQEKKEVREINGLVKVQDLDSSILIDLKYASENNFTGKKVYPVNVCVLRKETAQKLVKANEEFKNNGFRIKIWDAYRPPYVQQIFWDIVKDSRFVANPKNGGSRHNVGTAVDITLVDKSGNELSMPTKFDDFSTKAYRNNQNVSKEVRKNVDILTEVMKNNGFSPLSTEWWHFDDSDSSKYKVVDVKLEKFIN